MLQRLIDAVRARLEGRFVVVHGNRGEASVLNLFDIGAIPKINHLFTAVAGAGRRMASVVHALEDAGSEHPDLVWGHQSYWDQIERLCNEHPDLVLLCTYRRPQHEALLARYPGIILSCPPQRLAAQVEDKGNLDEILEAAGVRQRIPSVSFADAVEIPSYEQMVARVGRRMVIQIIASAGGARHDLKSSICFIDNKRQFEEAKAFQAGHGPCKVARWITGRESNGAGIATPWGVYVDPPSHKPVGLPELYGRPGSGAGNDWTFSYGAQQLAQYEEIVSLVGAELARRRYHGTFGIDNLFGRGNPWPHEINARSQGTTESQERASFRAGLPSLPLFALALDLGVPQEFFPDPAEYNQANLARRGGWYLKVNAPTTFQAPECLNGLWSLDGGRLLRSRASSSTIPCDMSEDEIYIYGAPGEGKICLPGSGLPTLYVNGWKGQVFTDDHESLTSFGRTVLAAVYQRLLGAEPAAIVAVS